MREVEKETGQGGESSKEEEFGTFRTTMSDAITTSSSDWLDLPEEILDEILSKMSFISILNFRAVCPSWRTVVRSFISSSSYSQVHLIPWLLLPGELEDKRSIRFSTLGDQMVFKRTNTPPEFYDGLCLGTSHSWLVMLDENIDPYLFNPFSLEKIPLPKIDTYLDILCVSRSVENGYFIDYYESPYECVRHIKSVHDLRANFVSKAVVSANPSHNNGNFFVLMIFEWGNTGSAQLAFCCSGDNGWMQLGGENKSYCDVICHNDMFYALNYPDKIEIWDVHNSYPVKRTEIVAKLPQNFFDARDSLRNCAIRSYLVEVSGDLFVVVRFIGTLLYRFGPYLLEGRHGTLLFQVYKLDTSKKKWEEVESLGDQVYFIGANQSKSLLVQGNSSYKANSIYFTDDSWDMMYVHNMHFDIGVFHMEDKSIKSTCQFDSLNKPPPFWIDPESLID